MAILTEAQIKEGYFYDIGGFPSVEIVKELEDYKVRDYLCIACTQLDYQGYSESEKKHILNDWVVFLKTNPKLFKRLHFNSHVPQKLFDAACCQENLEELRFKWGSYTNLTPLQNLKKLKYLYIGSAARVQDISVLGNMENLIVLFIQNFKKIEDYSSLTALFNLEQLVISGPTLGNTPIKDLEFLRDMQSLVSVWLPNAKCRKKYTSSELEDLRKAIPNLHDIYGCIWGAKQS